MEIKCILFDLGGVLVELKEEEALMEMCPGLANPEAVREAWFASAAVRAFETGKIGFAGFCEQAIGDLGVEVDEAAFREAHSRFLGNPFPGAINLLRVLKNNYKIACLSNTNPVHIDALRERTDILDLLDQCFLSYQTGLVKPDRAAFADVVETMGLRPPECLFLDDRLKNVRAARALGMQAEKVVGIHQVQELLLSAGLLRQSEYRNL
ncbi:MAG: HAD family hydrolase [Puniceicoccaceae bacterium]